MKAKYGNSRGINCDNGNDNASRFANAGGNWNNTSNAGAFHLNVNNSATNTNTNIGAHLTSFNTSRTFNSIMWANIPKG